MVPRISVRISLKGRVKNVLSTCQKVTGCWQ